MNRTSFFQRVLFFSRPKYETEFTNAEIVFTEEGYYIDGGWNRTR